MSQPTSSQQLAIDARGNVLVEAGAGSGKTRTLVQRCLARVLDPVNPVSLDQILMVTFTEAAAAEMRRRIADELARAVMAERQLQMDQVAGSPRSWLLEEQLALLDTAKISTLHSFCLQLIREHFHELSLDPQLAVLDEAQSAVLARQTLDDVLSKHYAGGSSAATAVQDFIATYGDGGDERIRALILRIHRYARSRDDADDWLRRQCAMFQDPQPTQWTLWLAEGVESWKCEWLETLAALPLDNIHARQCAIALESLPVHAHPSQLRSSLETVIAADVPTKEWKGKKGVFRPPLAKLFEGAAFLLALAGVPVVDGISPLDEDWNWVHGHMLALLGLVQEFQTAFATAKREQGTVDFSDLEQFALVLLWDSQKQQPTDVAHTWRSRLELVFVDEYQDINAAQDRIITCLSREGEAANRFLVGDVKQSIYRFRLANPRIFQRYAGDWRAPGADGQVIPLADNFRSHEAILDFANEVFSALMKPDVGGVSYDEDARLRFGNREEREALTRRVEAAGQRVEWLLRLTEGQKADPADDDDDDAVNLSNTEKEARAVALRLRALKEQGFQCWNDKTEQFEAVVWKDMAVLLRSPGSKAETFAKEFSRAGVPLEARRSGFYDTTEISDLQCLLTLLDNPLQDIPLLAVLRSPLVGLTVNELATIRLALRKGRYWDAVLRFRSEFAAFKAEIAAVPAALAPADSAWPKADRFLNNFSKWRQLARQGSLAVCLESVLDETCYKDWLRALPRGDQQLANVRRLCDIARRFDQFQRQGLYRFLRFIEAGRETETRDDVAPTEAADAVRLMSIHQSKGQEFPVVVLAGLGTKFNFDDLRADILLDEEFGLCPMVRPPEYKTSYPSLAHWLAARRQRRETLGEEIRLLYVAMTRARDKLILAGTASRKRAESDWSGDLPPSLTTAQLTAATKPIDWLGLLLPRLCGQADWAATQRGDGELSSWRIITDDDVQGEPAPEQIRTTDEPLNDEDSSALIERLNWQYPQARATVIAAKTSVTDVRRRLAEADEEARPFIPHAWQSQFRAANAVKDSSGTGSLKASEIGTAHHVFLQHVDLDGATEMASLHAEVRRLVGSRVLADEQAKALNLEAIMGFWNSDIGVAIRGHSGDVRRELPFTARFTPEEVGHAGEMSSEEFVVVQGVVDLAVVLPDELWLLDFKTDDVTAETLPEKLHQYDAQLNLYGSALERLYQRPVTNKWLHFLMLNRTIKLPVETETNSTQNAG